MNDVLFYSAAGLLCLYVLSGVVVFVFWTRPDWLARVKRELRTTVRRLRGYR